eukprot:COSAG05_NODE_17512_length_324_cov_0.573333_2_plen_23_part_01
MEGRDKKAFQKEGEKTRVIREGY